MQEIQQALTFDDVLLVPALSEVLPREVELSSRLTRNIVLKTPIVSSAMDTVTEAPMAIAMAKLGGIGVIHKNMPLDVQCQQVKMVKAENLLVAAAVGVKADTNERIGKLVDSGADAIVIDTAHGHSLGVLKAVENACKTFDGIEIIAGNVATGEGAKALADAGVSAVKVGIGPGSICTTRVVAGVGVPQLTAIMLAAEALKDTDVPIIADGGIRYSGDIVKALAAGASTVMLGSILAASAESPGEIVEFNGVQYKKYRGMGSLEAMECGSKDRYFQDGENDIKKLVPEGVVAQVPFKGSVNDIIYQMVGGLRSGMGYVGAKDIEALHGAKFVKITTAGFLESHPHDVTITKNAPNYSK